MNERAHCPYLGLRQNRAIRFAAPTSEHRCYVTGEAQDIPVDQRTHCLSVNHRACPLYTGEWSATTPGMVAATGALSIPQRGARGRMRTRDSVFYMVVLGLIATITAAWIGIAYLYNAAPDMTIATGALPTATPAAPTTIAGTSTGIATTTPTEIVAPPMPEGLVAVVDGNGVSLQWQASSDPEVIGYLVSYTDDLSQPFKLRLKGAVDGVYQRPFFQDNDPLLGRTVYYRVTAITRARTQSKPAIIPVPVPAELPKDRIIVQTPTPAPTSTPQPPTLTPVPPTAAPPPVYYPPAPTPLPPTPVPPTNTPQPTPVPPTAAPTDVPTSEPTSAPTTEPTPFITETPVPTDTAPTLPPEPTPAEPSPPGEPQPSRAATSEPTTEPTTPVQIIETPVP